MSMILEYPVNIFILTVVVIVVIGIMFHFRDQIMNICLFPPCEEDTKCDVKTAVVTETVNKDVLENYCKMCLAKNRNGDCKQDALCYVVNVKNVPSFNPSSVGPLNNCSIDCSKNVTSFFVQYNFLDKNITIEC
ncbi:MAG: hypothetical protein NTW30_00145 [Candidatus Aenigmarchaeota archaeon]|nr:hypothetical protein [Candidatus Aenigmarchaeota archaeon]